jgi:site-specific recombinase XerD
MPLTPLLQDFLTTLESPHTARAYETDLRQFQDWWGGTYEAPLTIEGITRVHVRDWLDHRPDVRHEALFLGQRGNRLSTSGLRRIVKKLSRGAVLKDTSPEEVTPHTFRHTWIKRMMDDPEIPLNVILDLAGHASADSLKPYTVPSAHDRQQAVERLSSR